jgi:phosphopantetheine adenylyltransferase
MKYLKRFWNWLLGKTTIDEKIEAKVDEVVEEVKERVNRVKEEVADVKASAKEVVSQA